MNRRTKLVVGAVVVVVAAAAGTGVAVAAMGDDNQPAITGDALSRASAAALAHTGGGKVTGTEVGGEESYYQVEVTKADAKKVDVQLDQNFTVVTTMSDGDTSSDTGN
jgi:uncharacterized membrane protein YkoI